MGDREKHRDRERERERDRERDREKRRDKDDRSDRVDRHRSTRSRTRSPDRNRSRHTRSRTRSPDRYRSRSRSPDSRTHRRHRHHRTPSASPPRKRHRLASEDGRDNNNNKERDKDKERDRQRAAVAEFVDGIAQQLDKVVGNGNDGGEDGEVEDTMGDENEIEMMKKLGIPVGFDSTKGKPVAGADVSGVRMVTKRQPRQYMNRRGGFNRPLPPERNR